MGSEGEPVNEGWNHGAAFKQLRPAGERQICGNYGAGALTSFRDDLK